MPAGLARVLRSSIAIDPAAVSRLLTPRRLRVYPLILIAAYVVLTAAWILRSSDLIDPSGPSQNSFSPTRRSMGCS
jgi:hypothetical protein